MCADLRSHQSQPHIVDFGVQKKHTDEEEADTVENATQDELIKMYKKESTMSVARDYC